MLPETIPLAFLRTRPTAPQLVYSQAAEIAAQGARTVQEDLASWREWLARYFPHFTKFAPRHIRLYEWFSALRPGVAPRPRVEIWPRGGAKSSTGELGTTYVGARRRRKFALYVSNTQDQANKHVGAISATCQRAGLDRAIGKYGSSLGWSVSLLRVANGFNVVGLGLDAAGRGLKLEEYRPDLMIFDDVDDRHDTERSVAKKIATITESILPMGSPDVAILVLQNLIHAHSIVKQLADGRAEFLHGRDVPPPEPAVEGLEYEAEMQEDGQRHYRITAGHATWPGQDLATCEFQMNTWGRIAFLREAQHDLSEQEGGMWQRDRDIDPFRYTAAQRPQLDKIVVSVDPNATSGGDEPGVLVEGSFRWTPPPAPDGQPRRTIRHVCVLEDCTPGAGAGPKEWAEAAVAAFHRWGADALIAEANNGGEMVAITISTVRGAPKVQLITASRGKKPRAQPVQKVSEEGRVHHVGVFVELERQLCTWKPEDKESPGRLDAHVWAVTYLLDLRPEGEMRMPWYPGQQKAAGA